MAKSNEPIWWSLFAVGGMTSAFLMPVTVALVGFAAISGVPADRFFNLLHHPLARLYMFVVIVPSLFHGAHRMLLTLVDLGLKGMRPLLAVLLYGAAIVGTALTILFLFRLS